MVIPNATLNSFIWLKCYDFRSKKSTQTVGVVVSDLALTTLFDTNRHFGAEFHSLSGRLNYYFDDDKVYIYLVMIGNIAKLLLFVVWMV